MEADESFVSDGNPLIYALKGLNDWKIDNESRGILFKTIETAVKKLPKVDVVIILPSSNPLMKEVRGFFPNNVLVLNRCVIRLTKEEVQESLAESLGEMDEFFEAKKVSPKKLLTKFPPNLFKINGVEKNYFELVNDKKVLIIDDSISSKNELSYCSNIISEGFVPKEIIQFSLFT